MDNEEYSFVSLEGEDAIMHDAVVIDMEDNDIVSDFVILDDVHDPDTSDYITLSDDLFEHAVDDDYMDHFISDIQEGDISFIV